jgi:hypothetical protein
MEDELVSEAKRQSERKAYEYAVKRRADLYRMPSWPFSARSGAHLLAALAINGIAVARDAVELMRNAR